MQGGTSSGSSAASTYSPSESKLASGEGKSPTPKKSKRGPQKLNQVGRRYQLARELTQTVPWLQGASVPRIAWIIRHVADAGWTALEVQAAAEKLPVPQRGAFRPSGLLASRLASCHLLYTTPERRQVLVEDWQDSRRAAQDRHEDADFQHLGNGPRGIAARRAMDEAFAVIQDRLAASMPAVELAPLSSIEELTREEVIELRLEAMQKPEVVPDMIKALGERDARRLYTSRLVDQALALQAINARNTVLAPAF
jgi:hypothetical protein